MRRYCILITFNLISYFRALGFLGYYLSSIGDDACLAVLDMYVQCLHGALMSTSGSQHMVAAMTVTEWASLDKVCTIMLSTIINYNVIFINIMITSLLCRHHYYNITVTLPW